MICLINPSKSIIVKTIDTNAKTDKVVMRGRFSLAIKVFQTYIKTVLTG